MDNEARYRVVYVEHINKDGVAIAFADGKEAWYSGVLLRQMFPQAKIVSRDTEENDD
jgi:hypothetical protein